MIDFATENDTEVLRQVARLQHSELTRRDAIIKHLQQRLLAFEGNADNLQIEMLKLQEKLAAREHALFGASSERRVDLEDDAEDEFLPPPQPPAKRGGRRPQPSLPIVEVFHTLDEADEMCPVCGDGLRDMHGQFEESEEIDVHIRYEKKVHKRKKYRCKSCDHIETALGPQKLQPGSRYSIDFGVHVVLMKYLHHMPWERLVRWMRDDGLDVSSAVLWDQSRTVATLLESLHERLGESIRAGNHLSIDETRWLMMGTRNRPGTKRWQAWGMCNEVTAFYRILDSRSADAAQLMLAGFEGVAMSDGYTAYDSLRRRAESKFVLAHCWAHVRRKFVEAEKSYPEDARRMIRLIRKLYHIEDLVPRGPPGDEESLALRAELRRAHSRKVVKKIEQYLLQTHMMPESSLGRAAKYATKYWRGLTRFLEDPRIELDNNRCERGLRGLVLGRKNFGGTRSPMGAKAAAILYSVCESAKLAGVSPKKYVSYAVREAIEGREPVLPHEFQVLSG